MSTLAFSDVAHCRLQSILAGILLAVVLSLVSAEAWAVQCRFNDQAGPQEMFLNVPTIEMVYEAEFRYFLLWRSPLQRVQISCFSKPSESDNQAIVISTFPRGHWSFDPVNVNVTVDFEGKTSPLANGNINTGHIVRSGETKVVTLEYYVNFLSGGWRTVPIQVANYPLIGFHVLGAAWHDQIAYQIISTNFIPRPARTCALSMADRNRTVRLPVIGANRLSTETPTGGRVNFDLRLSDCSAAVNRADFTFSGRAAPGSTDYFANRGTASGVALHLGMRDGGQTIAPQGPRNVASVVVTGRRGTLPLFAQYYRTAEVAAGTFNTTAEFTLSYQ